MRAELFHRANPMHLYCRLAKIVGKKAARRIAMVYQALVMVQTSYGPFKEQHYRI